MINTRLTFLRRKICSWGKSAKWIRVKRHTHAPSTCCLCALANHRAASLKISHLKVHTDVGNQVPWYHTSILELVRCLYRLFYHACSMLRLISSFLTLRLAFHTCVLAMPNRMFSDIVLPEIHQTIREPSHSHPVPIMVHRGPKYIAAHGSH